MPRGVYESHDNVGPDGVVVVVLVGSGQERIGYARTGQDRPGQGKEKLPKTLKKLNI